MILMNRSLTYRTSALEPIVRFVANYAKDMADDVDLLLFDGVGAGGGRAYLENVLGRDGSMVMVRLPPPATYPQISRAVPVLPAVPVRSWDEALVLILAHELCHIRQFRLQSFCEGEEAAAEADAEGFGRNCLNAYRKSLTATPAADTVSVEVRHGTMGHRPRRR